jgi:cytochrome b561
LFEERRAVPTLTHKSKVAAERAAALRVIALGTDVMDRETQLDSRSNQGFQNYDATTILLHWGTATLVVVLWIIGQTADWAPKGGVRSGYWSIHVLLGFALAIVLVWRIVWRTLRGRRLPPADSGILRFVAEATHYALYGLLLTVAMLGIANAFVRGFNLFDIASLPQLGDTSWRRPITHWHGLAANILLGLALFHAVAALVHHFALRDRVLLRMLRRRR